MPAEDFEENYISIDESEDLNFAAAFYGLMWAILSIPFMGAMILLYIGWVAALISMIILLIIYVVFILIDLRFSEWVK